jgi:hypothetical protein
MGRIQAQQYAISLIEGTGCDPLNDPPSSTHTSRITINNTPQDEDRDKSKNEGHAAVSLLYILFVATPFSIYIFTMNRHASLY